MKLPWLLGAIKIPKGCEGGSLEVYKTSLITFGGAAADYVMNDWEMAASTIELTSASGVANLVIPAPAIGPLAGSSWLIYNNSGQTITFKVAGGSGATIANGKVAMFYLSPSTNDIKAGPTT